MLFSSSGLMEDAWVVAAEGDAATISTALAALGTAPTATHPKSNQTLLYAAALAGNLRTLDHLVGSCHVSVDLPNCRDLGTALHAACLRGNVEIVEYLLQHKARVLPDTYGDTPLDACDYSDQPTAAKCKEILEKYTVTIEGFLGKRGRRLKTYRQGYFVLKGRELFRFRDKPVGTQSAKDLAAVMHLSGATVKADPGTKHSLVIELVPLEGVDPADRRIHLAAKREEDFLAWLAALQAATKTVAPMAHRVASASGAVLALNLNEQIEKLVIIGAGLAGHMAAIYAGRARLWPTMYEGFMAGGVAAGGLIGLADRVENFPGFPDGVSGGDLVELMRSQSSKNGAKIVSETVSAVDLSRRPFGVTLENGASVRAECIIIAAGAAPARLDLPGEQEYWQRGVATCALCDGASPQFRRKPIAVIGGGDPAAEEARFLTRFASRVFIVVAGKAMTASKAMQEHIVADERIEVLLNTQPLRIKGDGKGMTALAIRNLLSGQETDLPVSGLFYAIGRVPNTSFLNGQLKLDSQGYIITKPESTITSVPGVFACGDIQNFHLRQAIVAAGSGCLAALEAQRFLEGTYTNEPLALPTVSETVPRSLQITVASPTPGNRGSIAQNEQIICTVAETRGSLAVDIWTCVETNDIRSIKVWVTENPQLKDALHPATESTLLYAACEAGNLAVVRYLVEDAKVNPNVQNGRSKSTPLHTACMQGNAEVAQLLLKCGAKMLPDAYGDTPLDVCEYSGDNSVKALIQKAFVDAEGFLGRRGLPGLSLGMLTLGKYQQRYFVLKGKELLCFKDKPKFASEVPQDVTHLSDSTVAIDPANKYGIAINIGGKTRAAKRQLLLQAKSDEERSVWIAKLTAALEGRRRAQTTLSAVSEEEASIERVVIIGSGLAGHMAAIYIARARLRPVMFEGFMAGGVPAGGLITLANEVENFPGFPDGVAGSDLASYMRQQSVNNGCKIVTETVSSVDLSVRPFVVTLEDGTTTRAESLLIAAGAAPARLHLPGEEEYWQRGVATCGLCDGASPLFKRKPIAVIGGGDPAVEEALFLTRFASKVHLIVPGPTMSASKVMQEKLTQEQKIELHLNTQPLGIKGDRVMTHLTICSLTGGEPYDMPCNGIFYAIGRKPNTEFLNGQLKLDEAGFIYTKQASTQTSVPGVFACGDIQVQPYRQAVLACRLGCLAALEIENFLEGTYTNAALELPEAPPAAETARERTGTSLTLPKFFPRLRSKSQDPAVVASTTADSPTTSPRSPRFEPASPPTVPKRASLPEPLGTLPPPAVIVEEIYPTATETPVRESAGSERGREETAPGQFLHHGTAVHTANAVLERQGSQSTPPAPITTSLAVTSPVLAARTPMSTVPESEATRATPIHVPEQPAQPCAYPRQTCVSPAAQKALSSETISKVNDILMLLNRLRQLDEENRLLLA
eukprot:TRINITY_DN2968_c0_g1_i1.p1 TRINITY_DN2968_c0_g1~~TRINITY_DN2968_c0_g1_i1.p1  ORF type:complete len:1428 (+),score=215.21 TRINITY_DN2968_c0_g1_i1:2250-6533(+)